MINEKLAYPVIMKLLEYGVLGIIAIVFFYLVIKKILNSDKIADKLITSIINNNENNLSIKLNDILNKANTMNKVLTKINENMIIQCSEIKIKLNNIDNGFDIILDKANSMNKVIGKMNENMIVQCNEIKIELNNIKNELENISDSLSETKDTLEDVFE